MYIYIIYTHKNTSLLSHSLHARNWRNRLLRRGTEQGRRCSHSHPPPIITHIIPSRSKGGAESIFSFLPTSCGLEISLPRTHARMRQARPKIQVRAIQAHPSLPRSAATKSSRSCTGVGRSRGPPCAVTVLIYVHQRNPRRLSLSPGPW